MRGIPRPKKPRSRKEVKELRENRKALRAIREVLDAMPMLPPVPARGKKRASGKRSKKAKSPAEFIRRYKAGPGTPSERAAAFLVAGAVALPYAFFDNRVVAKIAFALRRIPTKTSGYVRLRLPKTRERIARLLQKEGRMLWTDRMYGWRASMDENDPDNVMTCCLRVPRKRGPPQALTPVTS